MNYSDKVICKELKKGITDDSEIISANPVIKSINNAKEKNIKYFLGKKLFKIFISEIKILLLFLK